MLRRNSVVTTNNQEVEIKLRAPGDPEEMRRRLQAAGFTVSKPRVFESNALFDTVENKLREASQLLRLRNVGDDSILTYKGPSSPGKHKSREEIETQVSDARKMELIVARLGFKLTFRYEKFRTEYQADQEGTVTLDETPIGLYIEVEGNADWIDRIATKLGFSEKDYITQSYGTLYLDYCRERGLTPSNMVFE